MKFENITKEEVLKIPDYNQGLSEQQKDQLKAMLESKDKEKRVILLENDLERMSHFYNEVIMPTIDTIISVLNRYNKKAEAHINLETLKTKELSSKDKARADIIIYKKIRNLFNTIFFEERRELVLRNLKKLRGEVASNRNINILQLNDKDIKCLNKELKYLAFTIINKSLGNIIFFNSQRISILNMSICFISENLYSTVCHELTHLIFDAEDKTYYSPSIGTPFLLNNANFDALKALDLSNDAESYMLFIFTAAVFIEQEYKNMKLKSYNEIPKACLNFLPQEYYNKLLKKQKELNWLEPTVKQLKISNEGRKARMRALENISKNKKT